jgi:CubicO group peptidase (beta-lactamase class C family)
MRINCVETSIRYKKYLLHTIISLLFVCTFLCSSCVEEQAKTPMSAYMTGENALLRQGPPETVQDLGDRLEANLDAIRNKYRVAGVAVAIMEGVHTGDYEPPQPRLLQSGTAGRDASGTWREVDARKTVFESASLTKLLVAWTLIHNQAELGIDISRSPFEVPNSLDLSGSEWNPWINSPAPSSSDGFTLSSVMQHKAGLVIEGMNSLYPWGWPDWLYGPQSLMKLPLPSLSSDLNGRHNTALAGKLVYKEELAGKFNYSSGNYGLLQMLIDQKSPSKGFDTYMQGIMEDDLHMMNSTFDYDPAGYLYARGRDLFLSQNYTSYTCAGKNRPASLNLLVNKACGGLFTTVGDYSLFVARMMADGIRPGTPDDRNVFCDNNKLSYYDPASFPTQDGYDVYIFRGEHLGWTTRIIADPAQGNAIVIFVNTADPIADAIGFGTGENLIREVFDAWMLMSGYGHTLREYHLKSWDEEVNACMPYYGE